MCWLGFGIATALVVTHCERVQEGRRKSEKFIQCSVEIGRKKKD